VFVALKKVTPNNKTIWQTALKKIFHKWKCLLNKLTKLSSTKLYSIKKNTAANKFAKAVRESYRQKHLVLKLKIALHFDTN
jgi:hypothetical protein